MVELIHGDCLEEMQWLADQSVDFVLTDPPYGTTACKWDSVIPFDKMWRDVLRVVKPNAAICLFGSEPFSSALRMSNIKQFKYDWIWHKSRVVGAMLAKRMPMRSHEVVSVFYSEQPKYFPQMTKRSEQELKRIVKNGMKRHRGQSYSENAEVNVKRENRKMKYPQSVQFFNSVFNGNKVGTIHPNEKPIALLEYLIETYTLEGETVLDFTMGSGSTGVACKNLNRRFIGIERDDKYFAIAKKRIECQ